MIKKPIIGMIILLSIVSFKTNAQKLAFGCKAGIDLVNFRWVSDFPRDSYSIRLSYDYGVILNYSLFNRFQFQIEPGFIKKGSQIYSPSISERWTFKHEYITIPLILIIKPLKRLNIETGVETGFLVYSKWENPGYNTDDRLFKKFELSGIYGLSFNVFDNLYFTFRYVNAFIPVAEGMILGDPGPSYPCKIYNEYYSFGARFYFGKETTYHKTKRINNCLETNRIHK